jgi:EAL domain-containing protein (putative c-di-GMP-specific phosphodiesterase class I)
VRVISRDVASRSWLTVSAKERERRSDLASNTASRHVVQAVVSLARAFSLQTVGEGVEDAKTLTLLRELGVDYAQGYHIARPGPLDFYAR